MPYLIRVRLPDQPGALGRLASALGVAGVDIESVSVVDRDGGEAVDDLVVCLPPGGLAEVLVTAVGRVQGCVLETIRTHPGRARVLDEVALLDEAALSASPLGVVVAGLPDLFAARYALAVDRGAAAPLVASSVGAPEAPVLTGWLPLAAARELAPEELFADAALGGPDCTLVAAPVHDGCALVLARNGGAAFRPVEVLRLAHVARLLQLAEAARAPCP